MKKIFIIIGIIIGTLPAFSTQWIEVVENTKVDIDSIEPYINDYGKIEPDKFIFWVKKNNTKSYTFMSLENYYKKEIGYFVDKEIIDCKLKRIAIKANNIYDINSNLINRFDFPDNRHDWHYITPDSPEQAIYDEIFKFKLKYDDEQRKIAEEKQKKEEEKKLKELEQLEQNKRIR